MTDAPPPPSPEKPSKIPGWFLGFFSLPVSFGIGVGIGGAIDYTPLIGLLPLILFVVAMILGRNVPGFWQGLVWFFAIAAVVFTACVAIIAGSGL